MRTEEAWNLFKDKLLGKMKDIIVAVANYQKP